jgi:hypothetical protein
MKVQNSQAQDSGRTAIADACDDDEEDEDDDDAFERRAFLTTGGDVSAGAFFRRLDFLDAPACFRPLIPQTMYLPHFVIF